MSRHSILTSLFHLAQEAHRPQAQIAEDERFAKAMILVDSNLGMKISDQASLLTVCAMNRTAHDSEVARALQEKCDAVHAEALQFQYACEASKKEAEARRVEEDEASLRLALKFHEEETTAARRRGTN
jgi:ketopantoate hydroxymethyltransferase